MITLYRAVTQAELDHIRASDGRFLDSPHKSGEKGFFFHFESAATFARNAYQAEGLKHFVVRTSVDEEAIGRGRSHEAAGEGAGVYLLEGDLISLSPAEEMSF